MRKLAAGLLVVAVAGCGYRVRFATPPHIQTFSVEPFTNKTLERNLDFEFTQALVREIHAKTRLRAAPAAQADLLVTGEIDELERNVLRRKSRGQRAEMRLQLYVNVAMLDRRKNVMLFEGQRLTRRAEFSLNRGETFRQAREEVVRELARRVVSLAFEPWPAPKPQEALARGG